MFLITQMHTSFDNCSIHFLDRYFQNRLTEFAHKTMLRPTIYEKHINRVSCSAMGGNSFPILKNIYRYEPAAFSEANEMIDRYIHFGNYERIQLKTGEAPLARCLSC